MILLMAALMATFICWLMRMRQKATAKGRLCGRSGGRKIGVQLGTTGDIYVSDYENDGSGTKVERYNKGC